MARGMCSCIKPTCQYRTANSSKASPSSSISTGLTADCGQSISAWDSCRFRHIRQVNREIQMVTALQVLKVAKRFLETHRWEQHKLVTDKEGNEISAYSKAVG